MAITENGIKQRFVEPCSSFPNYLAFFFRVSSTIPRDFLQLCIRCCLSTADEELMEIGGRTELAVGQVNLAVLLSLPSRLSAPSSSERCPSNIAGVSTATGCAASRSILSFTGCLKTRTPDYQYVNAANSEADNRNARPRNGTRACWVTRRRRQSSRTRTSCKKMLSNLLNRSKNARAGIGDTSSCTGYARCRNTWPTSWPI